MCGRGILGGYRRLESRPLGFWSTWHQREKKSSIWLLSGEPRTIVQKLVVSLLNEATGGYLWAVSSKPRTHQLFTFLYSHQFVLFVCFFHLASPFISSSLQQMDAGLNFHLALVVLSSWAFECYLAYCQRDSGKTKARNAILQIHTFIECSLEEESWECRESYECRGLAFMLDGKILAFMSLLRWRWKPSLSILISCHYFSPRRTKQY